MIFAKKQSNENFAKKEDLQGICWKNVADSRTSFVKKFTLLQH